MTHLLGTGHLSRARALADAVAEQGGEALVVSGGRPAPHLAPKRARLLQLPSVASDGVDFRTLLTESGAVADERFLEHRRAALLDAVGSFAPDALVTELYPFGRRVLAAEFDALLEAAQTFEPRRPRIFASVRDVLAPPSSARKADATERRVRTFYDGVLVHSDPDVVRLEDSWPVGPDLGPRLRYTGYVAAAPIGIDASGDDGVGDILVSAGGGPVGSALFEAAARAAARTAGRRWRLLVGGGDKTERIQRLRALAGAAPVVVEPVRPDFPALLRRAALSVNQAGYNTMLDIAMAGVRSVIAPFEEGGETEQAQRAAAFAKRFGHRVLREASLTSETLADAVEAALAAPPPPPVALSLDGAAETARLLLAEA